MFVQEVLSRVMDRLHKLFRFESLDHTAPAEDPALDLFQRIEYEMDLQVSAGKLLVDLGAVPFPFAEIIGHTFIHLQSDLESLIAAVNAKAVPQVVFHGEITVPGAFSAGLFDGSDALDQEGNEFFALIASTIRISSSRARRTTASLSSSDIVSPDGLLKSGMT